MPPRFRYAEADTLARVETIGRGDRIYLPGVGPSSRARVVAGVSRSMRPAVGDRPGAHEVRVSYFTGAWSRPLRDQAGRTPGRELVEHGLRPFAPGTRIRVRRLVLAGRQAELAGDDARP